jgi:hypothetical protein
MEVKVPRYKARTGRAWRSGLIARRGAQFVGNGGHELGSDGRRDKRFQGKAE